VRIAVRMTELAELTRFPGDGWTAIRCNSRRATVARRVDALMLDPPVILLDEPMAALDPLVRFDLQEDLHAVFHSLRETVLLVTHDMAEAEFSATWSC
jgi:osmoprotectant transport system ATP-binding protein